MFIEIILGIVISGILLYLFYIYLEWCDTHSFNRDLYNYDPTMILASSRDIIEKYGSYMLPTYLSDTYKPLRFWIMYYMEKIKK